MASASRGGSHLGLSVLARDAKLEALHAGLERQLATQPRCRLETMRQVQHVQFLLAGRRELIEFPLLQGHMARGACEGTLAGTLQCILAKPPLDCLQNRVPDVGADFLNVTFGRLNLDLDG